MTSGHALALPLRETEESGKAHDTQVENQRMVKGEGTRTPVLGCLGIKAHVYRASAQWLA